MMPRDMTGRRVAVERRRWGKSLFMGFILAPVLLNRRRGERRTGFDRRRRVAPAYE